MRRADYSKNGENVLLFILRFSIIKLLGRLRGRPILRYLRKYTVSHSSLPGRSGGSMTRPLLPPRFPSTSRSEGAEAADFARKRRRFGSMPCARREQRTSVSRSARWTRAKRPPQCSTRCAAAQTSSSVQDVSSRAVRRASPLALAPLPAGNYGGLEIA